MTSDRQQYLTRTMAAASDFIRRLNDVPIVECHEPLESIEEAARRDNVPIVLPPGLKMSRFPRIFRLRASLIHPLLTAAEHFARKGLLLLIEDAYRTLNTQTQGANSPRCFQWVLAKTRRELDGAFPDVELMADRLSTFTATSPVAANHVNGSAIDITVLDRSTGQPVDRGADYLECSELTPMDSPFISDTARRNRDKINFVMADAGFLPYPYEFWHYSRGDADHTLLTGMRWPARYGPVEWGSVDGMVTPVGDIYRSLLDMDLLGQRLRAARDGRCEH